MSSAATLLFFLLSIRLFVRVPAESVVGSLRQKLQTERKGVVVTVELWCVAKNNAEDSALQGALDWACGLGGADCRPIQQGGPCFEPNDIQFHASYAFNDYYLRNGVTPQACDFGGTAALTSLNPGTAHCRFGSSLSAKNGSVNGPGGGTVGGDFSNGVIRSSSLLLPAAAVAVALIASAL
ncbi:PLASMODESMATA CALLOSE-BINDING PROTEIN 5-like [Wolffia australiana]